MKELVHETTYRVYYGDTDMMSVMYHGNYPKLFEIGRNDMIRTLYKSYRDIESDGFMLPVMEMNFKFIKPAFFDELLTIRSIVKKIPLVRFQVHTEIYNSKQELLTQGDITLVFVDKKTRKPKKAPKDLIETLSRLMK